MVRGNISVSGAGEEERERGRGGEGGEGGRSVGGSRGAGEAHLREHDACVICVDNERSRDIVHKYKVREAEHHEPAQLAPVLWHLPRIALGTHTRPPAILYHTAYVVKPAAEEATTPLAFVEQ